MNNKDLLIKEVMDDFSKKFCEELICEKDCCGGKSLGIILIDDVDNANLLKSFLESSLSRAFEEGVKNGWIACRREEDDKCECECEGCLEEHHCCNTKCGHKFNR